MNDQNIVMSEKSLIESTNKSKDESSGQFVWKFVETAELIGDGKKLEIQHTTTKS